MNPELTLVCFALPEEARPFRRKQRDLPGTRVLVHGMGRPNTERALHAVLQEIQPARVLTCGFAGALDPALALGTVLFETTNTALDEALASAGARAARFHCANRMAVTAEEKTSLRRASGADAVEMESGHVHALCRARGLPCATVRVISDTAEEEMPLDFNTLVTADMRLDLLRLAGALMKSPRKLPALLRLRRQTAAAALALAESLHRCASALATAGSRAD